MDTKIADRTGIRLDAWIAAQEPALSRARWQTLISEGDVTVNEVVVKRNYKLTEGDTVAWTIPEPKSVETLPEDIPLEILFEDAHIIVVNKPAGLVVHPAAGNEDGTLVNALLFHCSDLQGIGGEVRPGIVHRLDKDTSGTIVVAKTQAALNEISRQFKDRETEKEYAAIVAGVPEPPYGRVETLIGRHRVDRKRMSVDVRDGRDAITNYEVEEAFLLASRLRVKIETGRTHQIRVHMQHIKHPVIGDKVYGRTRKGCLTAGRQMLHAEKLTITHPDTQERMTFTAPLPADMNTLLEELREAEALR